MGANESTLSPRNRGDKVVDEDHLEVLNKSSMDLIEKTADFLKSMQNDNYGRFKLMQYRVSKRQFAVVERITSEFKDFENYCLEVDKRLRFDAPQLVRWIRAYKQCEKEYCSSFFKIYVSLDYIPHTLNDQLESRKKRQTHCGEKEIFNMIDSVLSALIYLKSNGIQHKFIQPKTILYDQANRAYLISDIQFLNGGISEYQQYLFGVPATFCYLSPQLLKALGHRQQVPEHSPSKSDIFSLGLCALEMATMKSVQSIFDFHDFKIYEDLLEQLLQEVQVIYSDHLSQLLYQMLSLTEIQRPDFDDLAYLLKDLSIKPQFIDSRQSLRASVISEEFLKSSNAVSKKSGVLERPASCNLLRSKGNNNNNQNSQIQKQNSTNKNQNLNNKPSQSILKKALWKQDGVIGEVEEEDYQQTAVNSLAGDSKDPQTPHIRVLEPILTHENDELLSPVALASNNHLGEISSLNLTTQRNVKQLSSYNQEDMEMQQQFLNKRQANTSSRSQLTNSSPKRDFNKKKLASPPKNQNNNQPQVDKFEQIRLQNKQQRSQSQISQVTKKPLIDSVEQEYEEFKAKQRSIYMQQKHQIIQNEQNQYQLDKQNWEQQQQQHILDFKKHEQLQQSYIQSQLNFDDNKKYLSSQQQLPSQNREFTNLLQDSLKPNQNTQIARSPTRSAFSTIKSPQGGNYNNRSGISLNTPNNNHIESYQHGRLPPSSGRNSQLRSHHQLNKSPKINVHGRSQFYNDENEYNYDNRFTNRSHILNNNDNTMYNDYQTNNLNNSRFDNSIINSKADMSMISNYELKDIHIQHMRRNDSNIQNTLNMLEERIDKIDQSLTYSKKPLRSSSNNGFAFHQNSKLLSNNNAKASTFQQQLKNNQQANAGSSAKSTRFYNNQYNDSSYPTPFYQGQNFENSYQSHY